MLLCLSAHLPLYFFIIKYPETIIPKAEPKANTADHKIVFFCIYPYNDNVNCMKNTAEYGMMKLCFCLYVTLKSTVNVTALNAQSQ